MSYKLVGLFEAALVEQQGYAFARGKFPFTMLAVAPLRAATFLCELIAALQFLQALFACGRLVRLSHELGL